MRRRRGFTARRGAHDRRGVGRHGLAPLIVLLGTALALAGAAINRDWWIGAGAIVFAAVALAVLFANHRPP
jgi:hypothetical protein